LGVPTGKENMLTRLPDVVRFSRGQVVDSEKFDSEAGRNKIERLLRQGALRDPDDIPQAAKVVYQSDFDIPLDRDPGGTSASQPGVIRLPGDDIEDDGTDDADPSALRLPSLVDGTPEARLQGEAVDPADTGGDVAPEPEDDEETETESLPDGSLPEPPSRGASTAVWQQFAARARLGTGPDASRTEIQDAYDAKVAERG
jgi:hypothetical protein